MLRELLLGGIVIPIEDQEKTSQFRAKIPVLVQGAQDTKAKGREARLPPTPSTAPPRAFARAMMWWHHAPMLGGSGLLVNSTTP